MHLQHTDPEGAVRMALDLGAKKSVGVHWGTWIMSDESYNLPPVDLAKARQKLGMKDDAFVTLPVGETMVVE
jgi:N-acyl-phosphatidylethanolamine-hydrolysing phospholipase D